MNVIIELYVAFVKHIGVPDTTLNSWGQIQVEFSNNAPDFSIGEIH